MALLHCRPSAQWLSLESIPLAGDVGVDLAFTFYIGEYWLEFRHDSAAQAGDNLIVIAIHLPTEWSVRVGVSLRTQFDDILPLQKKVLKAPNSAAFSP